MLHSQWLKDKQQAEGVLYVELGPMHPPVAGKDPLPARVALRSIPTSEWVQNRAPGRKHGTVPRLTNQREDDPEREDPELVAERFRWMTENVSKAILGINDVHPETGEEIWHNAVILPRDSEEQGRYDEDTDTVYIPAHRFDEGAAIVRCNNALVQGANYGAGVGEAPFRPFPVRVPGADG